MSDETRIVSGPYFRLGQGTRLNGIYEIEQFITAGGMGEIYRGRAIGTNTAVAIKTVRPDLAQNEAALTLFRKEASALHNLYHEAIVRYFVFTVDPALNLPYLAMEYVEGESLAEIVRTAPLDSEAIRILVHRLAQGLQAAHGLGIIHRDLSPDNILVPGGNVARAKIIDFGIARSPLGEGTVIGSGFAGKMNYVSPEQLGLFGGEIGPPSDIYSLGLVIAEAARGRHLDMGHSHVEIVDRRRRVPDLTDIDPAIRSIVQKMLQPNPKDRPQTMAEIASWMPVPISSAPRKRLRIAASVAGVAVLAGGAMAAALLSGVVDPAAWWSNRNAASPPEQTVARLPDRPEPAQPLPGAPSENESSASESAPQPPAVSPERPGRPPESGGQDSGSTKPPGAQASIEQVRDFLRGYTGGQCFFVSPVTIATSEAVIEAYGASPAPFMAFDEAFQQKLGFEPEINLRQVTREQCPVVDLLARRSAQAGGRRPNLTLKSDNLHSGDELRANVEAGADRHIELLLVSDDGSVRNLTSYAKRNGDAVVVKLRLEGGGRGTEASPQLVVALASTRPLTSLMAGLKSGSQRADRFVKQLLDESASGTSFDVTVKYFKLSGRA